MTEKLFGTDGVRGLANNGDMSPEMAFRVGAAITYRAKKRGGALHVSSLEKTRAYPVTCLRRRSPRVSARWVEKSCCADPCQPRPSRI